MVDQNKTHTNYLCLLGITQLKKYEISKTGGNSK